jgi:hypothetical protein
MTLQRTKLGTGCSAFDMGGMEFVGVQEIFLFYPSFYMFHFRSALCLTRAFESIVGGSYTTGEVRTAD